MNLDIKDFETVEAAIEYLSEHDERDVEELRVGLVESESPDPRRFPEEDILSRNPDLPVKTGDRTHQVLWVLNEYGNGWFLSNFALAHLTEDPTLTAKRVSPASNALFVAGYVNRAYDGLRVYHCMTEKGVKRLRELGKRSYEPSPKVVTARNDALEGDW